MPRLIAALAKGASAMSISRAGSASKVRDNVSVPRGHCGFGTSRTITDVNGTDLPIGDTIGLERVIGDRGRDANRIRRTARRLRTIRVILGRRSRKCATHCDKRSYKVRRRAGAMFCRLEDFSPYRLLLRQAARCFSSAVNIAAVSCLQVRDKSTRPT